MSRKNNANAVKKLKNLDKRCPDCDERTLILIMRSKERNNVIYSEKYIYCETCEWEKPYREKRNYSKFQFEEDA